MKATRYFQENKQNPVENIEVIFYAVTFLIESFLENNIFNTSYLCFLKDYENALGKSPCIDVRAVRTHSVITVQHISLHFYGPCN